MSSVLGRRLLALTFLAVLGLLVLWARSVGHPDGARPLAPVGMGHVVITELPPEAVRTINLILAGGPFPHPEDGGTYDNDALLLPRADAGYYRGYTVLVEGAPDDERQRIVRGRDGDLYYTDDGGKTFAAILGAAGP